MAKNSLANTNQLHTFLKHLNTFWAKAKVKFVSVHTADVVMVPVLISKPYSNRRFITLQIAVQNMDFAV